MHDGVPHLHLPAREDLRGRFYSILNLSEQLRTAWLCQPTRNAHGLRLQQLRSNLFGQCLTFPAGP